MLWMVVKMDSTIRRTRDLMAVISLGFGGIFVGAHAGEQDTVAGPDYGSSAEVPAWLRGTWTREWLQEGKQRSNTLDVHYLQTPTYFADVRVLKDRTGLANARSFADLTDDQLRLLAGQMGYTGRTTMEGPIATWHEDIAFRPSDGTPDKGRLERIARDRMYEHGLDDSYIESWKFLTSGQGRFLVIRVEHSGRLLRALVVVGNEFVYVRNRAKDLPLAASFDALIKATNATREQIVEYLDCEFSVGRVRGGSVLWKIERSTLPWREGRRLDFVEQISVGDGRAGPVPVTVGEDRWTVPVNTLSLDEIKALFAGGLKPQS
jgi:hypothetical protein